jgi:hypothetical protein
MPYVQYGVAHFVFLTFKCWVLTTGRLQAVCVLYDRVILSREGPTLPYIRGRMGYIA